MPRNPLPALALLAAALAGCEQADPATAPDLRATARGPQNPALVAEGREIFRFDTFGDETFWTDTLRMHERIQAALDPASALGLGLKVDVDALPAEVRAALAAGDVDLGDPATTVTLIGLDAVVGVKGRVENGTLVEVGITCALCHSTVDNSFTTGIGRRLDGWPNRDLDPGAIIALSEVLSDEQREVYTSWGPGFYDPRFSFDGQNVPVVLPPAFGLRHIRHELYTGDDVVSYWNAYVAITQMHGHGTFSDPRLGILVENPPDMVSAKLEALRAYQFSIEAPPAQPGSFDVAAARRGKALFQGQARCGSCHLGGSGSDINASKLHPAAEVGQDETYALRSVTKQYRTTPLRGLWNPPQLDGPYFHDGSAATLDEVVEHYDDLMQLELTDREKQDLVEYLKTL